MSLHKTADQVPLEGAYEWSSARCIMDVGGGRGEMLSRCMACAGPACRGILMDRPWVLDRCPRTPSTLLVTSALLEVGVCNSSCGRG